VTATVPAAPNPAGGLFLNGTENARHRSTGELLVVDHGEGSRVYDTNGRGYLDGLSGLYCVQIGYSYGEELAAAATAQLAKLGYAPLWSRAHPVAIELAERLAELAPAHLNQVFFTAGGSESVESAWKFARQYFVERGETARMKVIARRHAYHGLTLGALAMTDSAALKDMFGRPALDVLRVSDTSSFGRGLDEAALCDSLIAEITQAIEAEGPETVAMIIAEPVQNRGACFTPPAGYWRRLRQLCDHYGILLVADEVITAFGRLGEWFGSQVYDIEADMVTLAKGLTSGYAPMGAVLISDRVAEVLSRPGVVLNHGFTFGGHPLGAAIALKNLEIIERDQILPHARSIAAVLGSAMAELATLPIVGQVRGNGLFMAAEFGTDAEGTPLSERDLDELVGDYIPQAIEDAGLLIRVFQDPCPAVQLAPPLITEPEDIKVMVEIVHQVLAVASERMTS
jgi:adenosylmethionine-8-amino-7-oxononanoate aminotransferase